MPSPPARDRRRAAAPRGRAIAYEPGLPPSAPLMQRMPMGSVMKVEAIYDRPFWRADGLNGQAVTDAGPTRRSSTTRRPTARRGSSSASSAGDQLRTWGPRRPPSAAPRCSTCSRAASATRRASRRLLREGLGDRARGRAAARSASRAPGTLLRHGPPCASRVGRIHWAGTETSTYWRATWTAPSAPASAPRPRSPRGVRLPPQGSRFRVRPRCSGGP